MYKVFVNEKELSFRERPVDGVRSVRYEDPATLEMAVDLLLNTSADGVVIWQEDVAQMWSAFTGLYRVVEAAGGIIYNAAGDILFIYRLGRWDLPKGKIEKGEAPETAAVREVAEEVGLSDVSVQDFFNCTYHMYRERDGKYVLKKTHWFRMVQHGTDMPVPQTEEGITKVEWKGAEAIKAEVLPSTFQNIRIILHALD